MQIQIFLKTIEPLSLPMSYHHIIQGLIYNLIRSDASYSNFLHNTGYTDGTHRFKLFTFGQLEGHYSIKGKNIIFDDTIMLEIRSPMAGFTNAMRTSLEGIDSDNTIDINGQAVELVSYACDENRADCEEVIVKMKTPMCVSNTIMEGNRRYTKYYTPLDSEFEDLIVQNAKNKYKACYGREYRELLRIKTKSVGVNDKYVTRFKGEILITGWSGVYSLSATSEMIDFLYDVGIGNKNSQGFGMYDYL